MSYLSPILNVLITAIKKAGNNLTRDFSEIEKLQSSIKGHNEFVVSAFKKVEKTLSFELSKAKPEYPLIKDNDARPNGPHFLVSCIDGMDNFAHGIPHFAISIAVCENDAITAGVIYNPATDELYFSEKGSGAFKEGFRNHERLRVSACKDLAGAIVSTEVRFKENVSEYKKINDAILGETGSVRILGSSALDIAYVASGRFDASVSLANSVSSIAAGTLLLKEAGGYVLEINQKDIRSENLNEVLKTGNIMAVNANLSKKVYDLLNK